MTNFEKYKDDLMKIKGEFAVNKNTREVTRCDYSIDCEDCIFNKGNCFEIAKYKNHIYLFPNKPPINKHGIPFTSMCDYLNINIYNESMDLFSNIKSEYGLYDIKNKCFIKE